MLSDTDVLAAMNSSRFWTASLVIVISCARIGMGIFGTLSGPTLLYMAENVGVNIPTISILFTAGSFGILFGGVLGGIVKRSVSPNFRHLLTLGFGVGVIGLVDLSIPWIRQFWILVCVIVIGGVMYGYLEAGMQALVLQLWGEKESRPQIQLFHFMCSIGSFLTPLIAAPFLRLENSNSCPISAQDGDSFVTDSSQMNNNFTTTSFDDVETSNPHEKSFDPVGWAYIIAASWLLISSCLMVLLSLLNVEKKVTKSIKESGAKPEDRKEEPIRDVIWLFVLVVAFYFCCVTVANVYYNFLYSVTLCSGLNFNPTQASAINSVFWAGVGLGRITGLIASKFMKPESILCISIIISIADMIVICMWGETTPGVVWAMTAVHGYSTSVFFPAGVSWLSQYTNVAGTYMFIFNLGSSFGSLSMLALAGLLFESNPFNVMYLCLVLAVGDGIIFALAVYAAKRHKEFLRKRTSDTNNVSSPFVVQKQEG